MAASTVRIPNRGTAFADMTLGERARWVAWAQSHDWGHGAHLDDEHLMRGLDDHQHDEVNGWRTLGAFAATAGGLRDWAGY